MASRLNDLVSYNTKHNEANGHGNLDGAFDNLSWNCGVEGPTDDPVVERLRNRQVKNFLTLTMLAVGTPMLLMGDEVRRTQRGNNNAYCINDDTTWFDWNLVRRHSDVHRFVKALIALRVGRELPIERSGMTLREVLQQHAVTWHGVRLNAPDWGHDSHTLAATLRLLGGQGQLHIIVNAYWKALEFELPPAGDGHAAWRRVVDTFLESPDDIRPLPRRRRSRVQPTSCSPVPWCCCLRPHEDLRVALNLPEGLAAAGRLSPASSRRQWSFRKRWPTPRSRACPSRPGSIRRWCRR